MSARIALATTPPARDLDEDMAPLLAALHAAGAQALAVDWDDGSVDWGGFDAVLPRSTWDYCERLPAFLDWTHRVAAATQLLNPADVIAWNTDKHYLRALAEAGIAIIPSSFAEPGDAADAVWDAFVDAHPGDADLVVKPAVGAGSRDAERHPRSARAAAVAHIARLLAAGRSALVQPYLDRVDVDGETALVHIDGRYSHAIRKGPLLRRAAPATDALFAAERISAREPGADERALAERVLAAVPFDGPLAYARVDLVRAGDSTPCLLELELVEPSLFFDHAPGSAARLAAAILCRVPR
ncbi:MAG TPA: hypothetical protein VMR06_08145 [Dokdonella sp.]|uniref:ATP-grasp domain-containing protein n=1 Tax=Dokdonella sp. TaxID=2291710 RepID=UPI002CBDC4F1|nr:hypothetical protein [Dokdonella sp.]HUD41954.1 hypothetical protein [Dokdonella sp.]